MQASFRKQACCRITVRIEALTQGVEDCLQALFPQLQTVLACNFVRPPQHYYTAEEVWELGKDLSLGFYSRGFVFQKGGKTVAKAVNIRKDKALTVYHNTNIVRVVVVGVELPDVFLLDLEYGIT